MKNNKLIDVIKSGSIVVPLYLYKIKDKLSLDSDEFLFFIYLYNKGNNIIFNPNVIAEDLGCQLIDVMKYISLLSDKDLISVDVLTNDKNVREEYISLNNFYNKLSIIMMEEDSSTNKGETTIFSFMENEFGRTLSPSEYEVIKAWLSDNTSEELIKEAVKEAVLNGVSNLRYIDKILYEWKKKGIKTATDVEKNKQSFRENKKASDVEVFEYDWLDDDED